MEIRASALGEQIAEHDRTRLGVDFVETPEYRSLLETRDRCVIVGRRGTGKSAIFWRLSDFWQKQKNTHVITITPEDYQTIGFRSIFSRFHSRYNLVRASARLVWKYCIYLEILTHMVKTVKIRNIISNKSETNRNIIEWTSKNQPTLSKAHNLINPKFKKSTDSDESLIGEIPSILDLHHIENDIKELINLSHIKYFILIDRLDEGFDNDEIGAAIVSGAIAAISEINKSFDKIRPILFIRDNVNKSISKYDPDYTRNIEGEILRIHWDQFQLLNLVSRRINSVFGFNIENDQKIWDKVTADEGSDRELRGREGFRKCLQFTLYRPRDLLSLLNQAFYSANKEGRTTLILKDIENTAKFISVNRLNDLEKEYSSIFPSIGKSTKSFANGTPEFSYQIAISLLDSLSHKSSWTDDHIGHQDFLILKSEGVLRSLYGVGFIGTHDSTSETFTFCHDGRNPDLKLTPTDKLLIHPCYWIGLNITRNALNPEQAEQINDEYEIKITSQSPQIRANRIGTIITDLGAITEGVDGAEDFELWAENAIQTVFAGHLDNIERKPNGNATQRRDIVATNLCRTSAFQRIHADYGSRQIIFEIKNFRNIGRDEYRQMLSYLHHNYGRLGFIVTRDEDENLYAGSELDWVKELYGSHGKLIIRLTAKYFHRILSKLRSPEKYDMVDKSINKLIDTYERNYLGIQTTKTSKKNR